MIIGLTGTFGAGKGAIVDYLVKEKNFTHYTASGYLTDVIKERGMAVNRDSMIAVANELRATHSPSYLVEVLYNRAKENQGDAIIESLRAVAEVEKVQELGGVVVGVDAEPKLRYDRSVLRASAKDDVSYNKWEAQEKEESQSDDPTKQNIPGAMNCADYILYNNGTLEELHQKVDELLGELQNS